MEKQILDRIKKTEQIVVDLYGKVKTLSTKTPSTDAIIYNADGPFDIKEGFGNVSNYYSLRNIIPLPDGKMLIFGNFRKYQGVFVNGLARLNSDFTLDTTYNGGGDRFYAPISQTGLTISNSRPTMIPVLDSNQNLYMALASSYTYDGPTLRQNKIFKVDSLGNFDGAFYAATGSGPNDNVNSILVLPDDSIVITGQFTTFNGTSSNRILRINSNGTLNTSFITNMGTGFNNEVVQTVLTPAGKLLCLGHFTSYNGVTRNRIVQLNIDGTIDSSFNYAGGFTSGFGNPRVTIDPTTGNIYICDQNTYTYGGLSINRKLIRLTPTGNYDASFSIPLGSLNVSGGVWWVMYFDTVLNKLYLGGAGWNYGTATHSYLYRINTDGSLDTTYPLAPGEGILGNMNYITPIGTDYLYLCYNNTNSDWGDMPWILHRGFIIVNKNTGRLATRFTKTLNY